MPGSSPTPTQPLMALYAVAACPLVYAVVLVGLKYGGVMPEEGFAPIEGLSEQTVGGAIVALSLLAAAASLGVRRLLGPGGSAYNVMLLSMGGCELGAVAGLIWALMSGDLLWPLIAMGVSAAGCILHLAPFAGTGE